MGREIARSCRGLPLAIAVTGGVLFKDNRRETWRDVAKNLNLETSQTKDRCLEILGVSYAHLPHHLRPCFLYMGAFLGDTEISVSRLISLWMGEGFLKPSKSKTLEEVGKDCLNDLIDRNLILVCKRSCKGKIRTCNMHALLRDVCQQRALKEDFLHVVDPGGDFMPGQTPRRLSIRSDALQVVSTHDLFIFYHSARSLHCTGKLFDQQCFGFLYLRVLNLLAVHCSKFPDPITRLLLLRYLGLNCDVPLPPSMSKLKNLQTIVHHQNSFQKYSLLIWSMPNLRHLYVKAGCYVSDPLSYQLPWKGSVLQHLQTLVGISNLRWSRDIIQKTSKSQETGSFIVSLLMQIDQNINLNPLSIYTNSRLSIKYDDVRPAIPPKLAFPQKVKQVSLSESGIPWARMRAIGALPNLEVLKLRCEACYGPSWETVEGEFPQLVHLLLEEMSFKRWETEADHLPRLQRPVVRSCGMLEEIPCAIGDIPTLEMIHLVACHPSAAASSKQIQEEQESMGNESLKVCIL